jgi:hypothetical protein
LEEIIKTKVCTRCGQEKSLTEFGNHKLCKDGLYPQCKDCVKEIRKEYYLNNKEKIKKSTKEYSLKHKDKRKQWSKNYISKHSQELKELSCEWYSKNRDKALERGRLYDKENHLKTLIRKSRSRAKKKGIPYDDKDILYNYLEPIYNKGMCECCGKELREPYGKKGASDNSYSLDQIIPGAGYIIGNVTILCWRCNELKKNSTPDELFMIANWYQNKLDELFISQNNHTLSQQSLKQEADQKVVK